jgi:hypothetical protein
LHHVFFLDRLEKVLDSIDSDDTPCNYKCDTITKTFRLLDIVGGQKDGGPGPVKVGDELAKLLGTGHIDSRGGFI